MGNFKFLIRMRIDAGDKLLEYHKKTTQNDIILCIKESIKSFILEGVKSQTISPCYGIQCDEVSDSSNW